MLTRGNLVEAKLDTSIHGKIDATATHPDGLKIYRVADHWFPEEYLVVI